MMKEWLIAGCLVIGGVSCDKNKKETQVTGGEVTHPSDKESQVMEIGSSGPSDSGGEKEHDDEDRCVVPTPETAPPLVEHEGECPTDPVFGGVVLSRAQVTFPDAPNQPAVIVELARTDDERARGLMYRTTLEENAGMLFLPSGEPRIQSFWMRDTCIPLDMMFITQDGFIAGILENVPILNDERRSVDCPTSYVLEVNAGWSRAHGAKAGQMVKLPAL